MAWTRTLVLGGGGVTGIAWEVGVLAGLADAGLDLAAADSVIGTSAGAFVGAAVAGGSDLEALFAAQLAPSEAEIAVAMTEELGLSWYQAFQDGGANAEAVGRAFGRVALANPEPVSPAARRAAVEARLVTTDFPATLNITAIDVETGALVVFDAGSGISLLDAVTASGAVPGVWPIVTLDGRKLIDGGMASTSNAALAADADRVIVLAPLPDSYGALPGAREEAAGLPGDVTLITPDDACIEAIGPNPFDPTRRGPAAQAGRAQGQALALTW